MNTEYDAFVSYSHADRDVAVRIQKGIQSIGKPFWRRRESRVFLDSASLSASAGADDSTGSGGLEGKLATALAASNHFVLLASPVSAQSAWVNIEIGEFLSRQRPDHLVIALTDGALVWDDAHGRFDPDLSTACPAALVEAFENEPYHVDLTWLRGRDRPDKSRLRNDLSAIAAAVRNIPKDQLVGDDLRQQRRNLTYAGGAIVGLIVLAVLAVLAMLASMANAREAQSSLVSTSGALRSQTRPDQGLLVARAGFAIDQTALSARGLYETLAIAGTIDRFEDSHEAPVKSVVAIDGRVVSGDENGMILVRDTELALVGDPVEFGRPIQGMIGSVDTNEIAVLGAGGALAIIDLTTGSAGPGSDLGADARVIAADASLHRLWVGYLDGSIVEYERDGARYAAGPVMQDAGFRRIDSMMAVGDRLVVGGANGVEPGRKRLGRIAVFDVARDGSVETDPTTAVVHDYVTTLAPDTSREDGGVLFGTFDGQLMSWDLGPNPTSLASGTHSGLGIAFVASTEAGDRVVTAGKDGAVEVRDRDGGAILQRTIVHGGPVWSAKLLPNGHLVTGADDHSVALVVYDEPWPAFVTPLYEGSGDLTAVVTATMYDRETAIVADGSSLVWIDMDSGDQVLRSDRDGPVTAIDVDANGLMVTAVAAQPPRVEFQTVEDPQVFASFTIDSTARTIDIHPDGDIIAIARNAEGGIVEFRGLDGEHQAPPLTGLNQGLNTLEARFDSAGESLLTTSTSANEAWRSWPDLEPLGEPDPAASRVFAVAVGDDRAAAVATSDPYVQILQLRGEPSRLGRLWGAQAAMWSLAFGPKATMLASGNHQGWITIWDLTEGAIQLGPPIRAHLDGGVRDLAFSPTGATLLTLSAERIMAWDLDPHSWAEAACAISDRSLSADEWDAVVGTGTRPEGSC